MQSDCTPPSPEYETRPPPGTHHRCPPTPVPTVPPHHQPSTTTNTTTSILPHHTAPYSHTLGQGWLDLVSAMISLPSPLARYSIYTTYCIDKYILLLLLNPCDAYALVLLVQMKRNVSLVSCYTFFAPIYVFRNYSSDSQASDLPDQRRSSVGGGLRRPSGVATQLRPEYFKTAVSLFYMLLVTWITAIVMVFVHDRVPDKVRFVLPMYSCVTISTVLNPVIL